MMKSDITTILLKQSRNFNDIFHFQNFLGRNQMVKGMFVIKELLNFPKILPSQIFKHFSEYICGEAAKISENFS